MTTAASTTNAPLRILVIGAGAVGGYFGARLAAAGRDVSFLVRGQRAEHLRRNGLQVLSPFGDFTIEEPKLVLASDLHQAFDLILLSTKSFALASAIDDFAPAVGPGTLILPLLNGMAHLDALEARFGSEAVLAGSTRIVADLNASGQVHVLERLHDLVFGPRDGHVTSRVQRVADTLHGCGFDDQLRADAIGFMWQKWVLLASLGAITCSMRGPIGLVAAAPGGVETARGIIAEAAAIAEANGFPTPPAMLAHIDERLTACGSELTASMYRDLMRGAPVEADNILGDLLARGRKHHVEAPLLRAAYAHLCVYMAQRK